MKQITLTKSEKEIMTLLWNTDRPLTAAEIVNLTPERTWKKSYIHLLINSLIEKDMIQSESLVRTGRNFGRAFAATMTQEQFLVLQITQSKNYTQEMIPVLVSALLNTATDLNVLQQTEEIIQSRKAILEQTT